MNRKELRATSETIKQSIYDFFWVHFDLKTAKNMTRHPELAIPAIRDSIDQINMSKTKLVIFGDAIKNVLEYERIAAQLKQRPRSVAA